MQMPYPFESDGKFNFLLKELFNSPPRLQSTLFSYILLKPFFNFSCKVMTDTCLYLQVRSSVAKSWATRGDRSEASRGNRSVASRDDIDLDVRASTSSGKDSRASETKGNEALFKVAGVMLDTES